MVLLHKAEEGCRPPWPALYASAVSREYSTLNGKIVQGIFCFESGVVSVSAAGWPATAAAGVRLGGWARGGVKGLVRLSQFYELLTPLTPAGVGRETREILPGWCYR